MRWTVVAVLALAGCSRFPAIYSAAALAQDSVEQPGPALVHYLGQKDATLEVCHLEGPGHHLKRMDEEGLEILVEGLAEDRVAPARWQGCVALLIGELTPALAGRLLSFAGELAVELTEGFASKRGERTLAKLRAIHQVYVGRPEGMAAPALFARDLFGALRAVATVGGGAGELATDWMRIIDIEQGRLDGQPIDAARLEGLADEDRLWEVARRSSDAALRELARRRIIRLRIAASDYAILRQRAAEVEEQVLARGFYAVAPDRHPPKGIELLAGDGIVIVVSQAPWTGSGALRFEREGEPLAGLPLAGRLQVLVTGIDRPLTVCAGKAELDPTPCLERDLFTLEDRFARLDDQGWIRIDASLSKTDLRDLAERSVLGFELRVSAAARVACQPRWPLVFARPEELVFTGPPAGRGIDLAIEMGPIARGRHHFAVRSSGGESHAVYVETADLPAFRIISRGGRGHQGRPGKPGTNGAPGTSGHSASCPSGSAGNGGRGGDGTAGGPGGPGGRGGDGGAVTVRVHCSDDCHALVAVLKETMRSEAGLGGEGGEGGPGGQGGQGGPGGSGASCYVNGQSKSVSGGSAGPRGSDGPPGPKGTHGPFGVPGQVTLKVLRR